MSFETLTQLGASPPATPPMSDEARAVEVAVVLDDTVVAVHHLSPGPGKLSKVSWALAACAALGLGVFLALAATAVGAARDNRVGLRRWLEDGNAQLDFRPRTLHPLADLLAGVGLVSAIGFGVWTLSRAGRERRKPHFTVGEATVVAFHGAEAVFTPAAGMTGELSVSGQPRPFAAGPLPRGARVRAVSGPTTYLISSVSAPRAAAGVSARVDCRALGYAAASVSAHAFIVLLFFLIPADASGYSSDDLQARKRRVNIQFTPQEDPRLVPGHDGTARPGGEPGPSGATGTLEAEADRQKGKIKRTRDEESVAREVEPTTAPRARSAGILGTLHARQDQLTALTSLSDFTSGLDEETIRGGYVGDTYGDSRGWGTGPIGSGPNGGGREPGTIGTGPTRTTPYGVFRVPTGDLPGRRPQPTFVIGPPSVPEGIDKNMIRRYVRQKHEQISHCYERELLVKPGLTGTATTAFTIDQNGRVLEARARGMGGAPAVERCLEDVIRSIQFPKGGIVNVTAYPFTFHPVGGG